MSNVAVNVAPDLLTMDQFVRVLPKNCKKNVTVEMVDRVNDLLNDQHLRENFRDNLLSYTNVMADGKYKIQSYIDAVRYVSYKLLGSTNIEAYTKTFPDRFQRLVDGGASNKMISSFCAAYNKTKLVCAVLEQTLVPTHIINADLYQKALNVQADLMVSSGSDKVRCDAANSLLTHLKMPETTKLELDVNVKQDKSIEDLRASTLELVKQQKLMIESGAMEVKEVAHSKLLIEGEVL